MKTKKLLIAITILCLLAAGTTVVAAAAGDSYYLCLDSEDYRVYQRNALSARGEQYAIDIWLNDGERLLVSDGRGTLYGGADGQPVKISDKSRLRYTVTFDPAAEGGKVSVQYYAPQTVTLAVQTGESTAETAFSINPYVTSHEEYYAYADIGAGDTVTVKTENGDVYGLKGIGTDGVAFSVGGRYRLIFTLDEDFLYGDDRDEYIAYTEYPELYLLDKTYPEPGEANRMERDESVTAYAEYAAQTVIPDADYDYVFRVYDKGDDATYYPSADNKLTVADKGVYDAVYSPDHIYSTDSGDGYHVSVKWKQCLGYDEAYDGYYLLGDGNGWQFPLYAGDDWETFEATYRFEKVTDNTDYDEYRLEIELDDGDAFYITDGKTLYRRPLNRNIEIDRAGVYEILFSPEHDYGRGYSYICTLVAQPPEADRVLISDAAQLEAFFAGCDSSDYSLNKEFILTADIDMGGRTVHGRQFLGTLDGCYHKITGLRAEGALFSSTDKNAVICRLDVTGEFTGDGDYAGLVGINAGTLSEVTVRGTVEGGSYVGGLAGENSGKIEDCANYATVKGITNTGGIAGQNTGDVRRAVNYGRVNCVSMTNSESGRLLNTGGIAGYTSSVLYDCVNRGDVGYYQQGRNVGGVAGLAGGELYFCFNYGTVGGYSHVGGVAGYFGALQRESNAWDEILGNTDGGWLDDYFNQNEQTDVSFTASYCGNEGPVEAYKHAGGIAGYASSAAGTLKNSYSGGRITSLSDYAGGIAGELGTGTVSGCVTAGEILADRGRAGGIAGQSGGRIYACMSSALLDGGDYTGGIAGYVSTAAAVENCYTNINITSAGDCIGAIAGYAGSVATFQHNYYVGEVRGIDGGEYGYNEDYAAFGLTTGDLKSEGALSPSLIGFDSDYWLGGRTPQYPVARKLTECEEIDNQPDAQTTFGRYADAFACAERYAKVTYCVNFRAWNGDEEQADDERESAASFRVYEGERLDDGNIPANSDYEGYFVWWDYAAADVYADVEVYERWDNYLTTMEDAATGALAEGRFWSDTRFELVGNGEYYSALLTRGGVPTEYETVRVKFPAGKNGVIYVTNGGETVRAETVRSGDYLAFELKSGQSFKPEYEVGGLSQQSIIALSAGIGGGLLVGGGITAAVFLLVRARKRRRTTDKTDT